LALFEYGVRLASFGFDQPIVVDGDEVPETPAEPVSELGDLWNLGNHRPLCGDATVLADVERVLGGQLADMIWAKSTFTLGRAGYRRQYEPILYGWKDGPATTGAGPATRATSGSSTGRSGTTCTQP
jgi:hypothetical protein